MRLKKYKSFFKYFKEGYRLFGIYCRDVNKFYSSYLDDVTEEMKYISIFGSKEEAQQFIKSCNSIKKYTNIEIKPL